MFKKIYTFFNDNRVLFNASSLSFFTIFAITPTLLIILSILSYVSSFDKTIFDIKNYLFEIIIPTNRVVIQGYIDSFFANSSSMGFLGLIYVIVTSMMFFQNYEYVVNKIFNTPNRTFWEAISTYWTLTTLSPFALVLSVYLSHNFNSIINTSFFLPFFIIFLLFFINYKISPNKITKLKPTLISSFVASFIWFVAKTLFIYYIFYNTTYVSLYGSLSILIIFFLWVYLSWVIFLFGLKLSKELGA